MTQVYNQRARKKTTHVSINSHLLKKARNLKLNLSATLEKAVIEEIRLVEKEKWQAENETAVKIANKLVETNDLFSHSYRTL